VVTEIIKNERGAEAVDEVGLFLLMLVAFAFGTAIYLIPAIIAIRADHPNKTAIVVLNIFGGWTFIVWVVALVWALTKPQQNPVPYGMQQQTPANINVIQQAQMQTPNLTPLAPNIYPEDRQMPAFNAGAPKLIGISGYFAGRVVDLSQGHIAIGRDPQSAQLAYPSSKSRISRRHCIVQYEENSRRFIIEDTSTNGTYIYPQKRLKQGQPVYLEPGTRFYLGEPKEQYELKIE
jgi:hypothetical protein